MAGMFMFTLCISGATVAGVRAVATVNSLPDAIASLSIDTVRSDSRASG